MVTKYAKILTIRQWSWSLLRHVNSFDAEICREERRACTAPHTLEAYVVTSHVHLLHYCPHGTAGVAYQLDSC